MGLEKEDIMALIAILQKGLTDDEPELLYEEESPTKPRKQRKRSAEKPKAKPNKFDEMTEKNMHKQDSKIDKLLWSGNQPTDRGRPASMLNVRCRVCGKTESVNPVLISEPDRYKCNKCATSSG